MSNTTTPVEPPVVRLSEQVGLSAADSRPTVLFRHPFTDEWFEQGYLEIGGLTITACQVLHGGGYSGSIRLSAGLDTLAGRMELAVFLLELLVKDMIASFADMGE